MASALLVPPDRPRTARVTLALAALVGLAALWAVIAETRGERRTAQRVAADYVSLLGHERLDAAVMGLEGVIKPGLSRVASGTMASPYEELAAPPVAGASESALGCPNTGTPWYLRLDLRDRSYVAPTAAGDPLALAVRDSLLSRTRTGVPPDGSYAAVRVASRIVFFAVKFAPFGAPAGAYGLVACADAVDRLVSAPHGNPAADTLIRVAIVDSPSATPMLETERAAGLLLGVSEIPGRALGPIVQQSVIPPWLLFTLLAATLALGGLAAVQAVRDRAALRAQAEFVATVSHEMRTPLAQILLYAETLALDRVRSDDERRDAATRIASEARKLGAIVGNVVRLARGGESGRATRGATQVRPVIESAVRGVRPVSDASARVAVRVTDSPSVRADETTLAQIVANLLDNALKFGPAGQTVVVGAQRRDGWVTITVDDEGAGIPAAERDLVWRRYVRSGAEGEGAGIGLAVVRDLVHDAGGRARVEEAPGGGARFIVELEAADE